MPKKQPTNIRQLRPSKEEVEGEERNVFSDLDTYSRVPHWVLDLPLRRRPSSGAIHLFAVLAKYADNATGKTWVGRRTLADDMGVSMDTIDRRIKELITAEALVVEERKNGKEQFSNYYFLKYRNPYDREG